MRLSEYGDTNKFQKAVRINHKSTGALLWELFVGIKRARVGRRRKKHLSLDLSLLARDLDGLLRTTR